MAKHYDKSATPEPPPDPAPGLSDQQQADQSAARAEREPSVAPLRRATDEAGNPADRPPAPPTAVHSPAPRFVHQNERAPEGLRRFKIRVDNYHPQPVRYVLARDEAAARAHYLKATGLQALIDSLPDAERHEPRMSVRALPD